MTFASLSIDIKAYGELKEDRTYGRNNLASIKYRPKLNLPCYKNSKISLTFFQKLRDC